jgi:hypothetical protein
MLFSTDPDTLSTGPNMESERSRQCDAKSSMHPPPIRLSARHPAFEVRTTARPYLSFL